MLVVSREAYKSSTDNDKCVLQIGSDVFVKILSIDGRHVRIGVEAPKDVRVLRGELVGRPPKEEEVPA